MSTQRSRFAYLTAYFRIAPAWAILAMMFLLTACDRGPTPPPTITAAGTITPTRPPVRPRSTLTPLPVRTVTPTPFLDIDPARLRGITLRFWHGWDGEMGQIVQRLVDEFNAGNEFGITVEAAYQGNYNDLYASVETALEAGTPPDVTAAHLYQIMAWVEASGAVADLSPFVNDPRWGLSWIEQADFYPMLWTQEAVGEARYSLLAQRSAQVMIYNLSWASELGFVAPPETPQDFETQSCAATRANNSDADPRNDGSGGWVTNTTPVSVLSWMYAFRSQIVAPSGGGYQFHTPEAEAALSFLKGLYDKGCAWSLTGEAAAGGYGEGANAEIEFAARRALFVTASLTDLPYVEAALARAGNHDRWTVIAFPSTGAQPTITVYGPSYAVFRSRMERELAAWLFVKWLTLPVNQARWIEVSGTYPLRASALNYLDEYADTHPQWAAALKLLPYARAEPRLPSWSVVRWAVSDVGAQIFRYYFTADRIPATLDLLDETAEELRGRGVDERR